MISCTKCSESRSQLLWSAQLASAAGWLLYCCCCCLFSSKFCWAAVAVVSLVQKYSVELGVSFRLQQQPAGQTEIIKDWNKSPDEETEGRDEQKQLYVLLFRHQLLLSSIVFNTLPMGSKTKSTNNKNSNTTTNKQSNNQTTTAKSQNYATATDLNLVLITEMKKKKVARRTEFFSKNKWIVQTVRLTRDGM